MTTTSAPAVTTPSDRPDQETIVTTHLSAPSIIGLPAPTGPHPIGRTRLELVDQSRREVYGGGTGAPRELVLWIWYPTEPDQSGPLAEYLPPAWSPIADQLGFDATGLHGHATVDAPIALGEAPYPVLVLSPSGFSPLLLTGLAEQLASTGYVVVGVNHTYETAVTAFADGRVAPMDPAALGGALGPQIGAADEAFRRRAEVCRYKAGDLSSAADHLSRLAPAASGLATEHLDLERIGAVGHSFGGNAALEWSRLDSRCRAAANLDGAIWTEVGTVALARPALQILAEHPEFELPAAAAVAAGIAPSAEWYEAERSIAFDGWRAVTEQATPGHTMQITGATHVSFMDVPFLPHDDSGPIGSMVAATSIDPMRMWRITSDLLAAFFDRHIRGAAAPLLDDPGTAYPEVRLGSP